MERIAIVSHKVLVPTSPPGQFAYPIAQIFVADPFAAPYIAGKAPLLLCAERCSESKLNGTRVGAAEFVGGELSTANYNDFLVRSDIQRTRRRLRTSCIPAQTRTKFRLRSVGRQGCAFIAVGQN